MTSSRSWPARAAARAAAASPSTTARSSRAFAATSSGALDRKSKLRNSYENPAIQTLYKEYLGEPLSERAEELLHTDHHAWSIH